MAYEQPADINALYRELFGREADQSGLTFWQSQAPTLGTGNPLREAMIEAAAPVDATYYDNRNISEADWGAYTDRAAQQMAGINSMPGVLSDYGSFAGATPQQSQSMMYHDKDSLQAIIDQFKALYGVTSVEGLPSDAPKAKSGNRIFGG